MMRIRMLIINIDTQSYIIDPFAMEFWNCFLFNHDDFFIFNAENYTE